MKKRKSLPTMKDDKNLNMKKLRHEHVTVMMMMMMMAIRLIAEISMKLER